MKNKILLITILLLCVSSFAYGQAPPIQWADCLGGSNGDYGTCIRQTPDGGYITTSSSWSTDGDVAVTPYGGYDIWVVKLDSAGHIQWQKMYGSGSNDYAANIELTGDGGYILGASVAGGDGLVTGWHGMNDYWLVKIDDTGGVQWEHSYGGSGDDLLYAVKPTTGGGYVLAGYSASADGDVTANYGGLDCWVVRVNDTGGILWQRNLGGSQDDEAHDITLTPDNNGYVLCGYTQSDDSDVSGNHGGTGDYWVAKLDDTGHLVWQRCLGGSDREEAYSIIPAHGGGYVVGGWNGSEDGDVTIRKGITDYWVLKLSETGDIVWQQAYGSNYSSNATSMYPIPDGGYIIAGVTGTLDGAADDGDVTGFKGMFDYWIVRVDDTGAMYWEECLGGFADDEVESIVPTTDKGYIMTGHSSSNSVEVTGGHGDYDAWVVKLGTDSSVLGVKPVAALQTVTISPNPTTSFISVQAGQLAVSELTDITGKVVIPKTNQTTLYLSSLASGIYLLNVYDVNGVRVRTEKVVKE